MSIEALADNQSGESYYWYIRACKTSPCVARTRSRRTGRRRTRSRRSRHRSSSRTRRRIRSTNVGAQQTASSAPTTSPSRGRTTTTRTRRCSSQTATHPSHQTATKYRIEISRQRVVRNPRPLPGGRPADVHPVQRDAPRGRPLVARAGNRRRQQQARLEYAGPGGEEVGWCEAHRAEGRGARGGHRAVLVGAAATRSRLPARGLPQQRHDVLRSKPGPERGHEAAPRTSRRSTFPRPRRPTCGGSAGSTRATGRVPGPTATRSAWCPVQSSSPAPPPGAYVARNGPVLSWQPVGSAAKYQVAVRLDGATSSAVSVTTPATSYATTTTLADGAYEWRVLAYDATQHRLDQGAGEQRVAAVQDRWHPTHRDQEVTGHEHHEDRELHGDVQRAGHGSHLVNHAAVRGGAQRAPSGKGDDQREQARGHAQPEREPACAARSTR